MTSKRTLERRLNRLEPAGFDGPDEIIITDTVVNSDGDEVAETETRYWRDDHGEIHREELSHWETDGWREDGAFTSR